MQLQSVGGGNNPIALKLKLLKNGNQLGINFKPSASTSYTNQP